MDEKNKNIGGGVGMSISSTPDRTEITRPETTPRTARADFPFRLVLISDLAPEQKVTDWTDAGVLRPIDPNSLPAYLEFLSPTLHLDVDNKLQLEPRKLDLALRFRSFSDFSPDGLVQMVPELSTLWQIRSMVLDVGKGSMSADSFREKLSELGIDESWSDGLFQSLAGGTGKQGPARSATPSDDSEKSSTLESILDMVDLGPTGSGASDGSSGDAGSDAAGSGDQGTSGADHGSDEAPGQAAKDFVAALGTGGTVPAAGARQIARDIENRVGLQVQTILHSDALRNLEAKWHALKFLVDHLDFRSDVKLDVLSVGSDHMAEALHHQVVIPEHEGRPDTPVSLLVVDRAFGYGVLDIEALSEIASVAASIQTPAIASMSPAFWGCSQAEELIDLDVVWQHLQRPEYIEWSSFPESAESVHVSLAMPPFLLREPYGSDAASNGLSISEERRLWGAASIAAAALVARRFAESGWPTLLTGPGGHQLEELPLWTSSKGPIPLSATYPSGKQGELADAGFTVLGCLPGKDHVYLQTAPTAARLRTYEDDETTERARSIRSLDAQLFLSRIAHFLIREQSAVPAGTPLGDATERIATRVQSLLGVAGRPDAGEYASVSIVKGEAGGTAGVLSVSIRSPEGVLSKTVRFQAQLPLG